MLSGMFYSLQLSNSSFPKPLSTEEEAHYLQLSAQGDLQARNILIERNLRLVAHIMKNGCCKRKTEDPIFGILRFGGKGKGCVSC